MKLPIRLALSGATVAALAISTLIAAPAAQAATGANYPDPGKAYSNVNIKVGNSTDILWLKQISTRTLELDSKATQWKARYEVQVRGPQGQVLLDRNLSVYKVNWIYVHFNTSKHYASQKAMLDAFAAATLNGTETNARTEFKSIYGSLGKFRTTDGKLQAPRNRANYDPEAFSDVFVNAGRHEDRIWIKPISSRTLELGATTDVNRGTANDYSKAKYDVQVRNGDGLVIFDENFTVYRLDYFLRHFSLSKDYASDAAVFAALGDANAITEVKARSIFKDRYGTLGQFKTTDGKLQNPQKIYGA